MNSASPRKILLNSGTCARGRPKSMAWAILLPATDRLAARIETFFTVLPDSMDTFQRWRRIIVANEVKGAKVHDARLVAIMQTHGLQQLLTFNAADFRRYTGVEIIDPLRFDA